MFARYTGLGGDRALLNSLDDAAGEALASGYCQESGGNWNLNRCNCVQYCVS